MAYQPFWKMAKVALLNASVEMACLMVIQIDIQAVWDIQCLSINTSLEPESVNNIKSNKQA